MAEVQLSLDEAAGDLPPVCVCCGLRADLYKAKLLVYWPRWTWIFLIQPIIWAGVIIYFVKSIRIQAPLCNQHKNHWFIQTVGVWTSGLILLAIYCFKIGEAFFNPGMAEELMGTMFLVGYLCAIAWGGFVSLIRLTTIRASIITKEEIVLKGVAEEFVQAMQSVDRERQEWLENFESDEIEMGTKQKRTPLSHDIQEKDR